MRMLIAAALFAFVGTLSLAACAGSGSTRTPRAETTRSASPVAARVTVMLGPSAFLVASVTISAGQAVSFADPAENGGTHKLCLGAHGQCDPTAQDPTELLYPGLSLTPGTTQLVAFPHAGRYQVTCTIHPSMQLTISVLGVGLVG
jgi:plastocyanin